MASSFFNQQINQLPEHAQQDAANCVPTAKIDYILETTKHVSLLPQGK